MGWLARLFDKRDTWARMILLDLSGLSYLIFLPGGQPQPTGPQWALAIAAFVLLIALSRWPRVNFGVQVVLLAAAFLLVDDTTINQVGASWALGELVVQASRPLVFAVAAVVLGGVHLGFGGRPAALLLPVGLPLLLGLVIRTSRELGRQDEQRIASESRAARADERSAIARELHDVVAHHVASMVLRVGVARHVIPGIDPRVGEVLDDVHRTGTAALDDLRRLVAVLRDEGATTDAALAAIEPGALPAALGAAVDTARRSGLTVEADIDEALASIDAIRGLAVLRLTQEALTNVAKHAGSAARARLRVALTDGDVTWEVSDDGGHRQVSGDPATPKGPGNGQAVRALGGGHGLTGMRERVEVLGGTLTAGPDGTGWRVATVLPAHTGAAA